MDAAGRGRPRRYCSDRCRTAAMRERRAGRNAIPYEMTHADRWLRWKRVTRGDGTTKRPITIAGRPASSTDPATWCAWWDALGSTAGDGLGFALGGGFACIDLDHCYDSRGYLADWAKCLIAPVMGRTWIEISPSGDGLHIWGLMPERPGIKVRGIMDAEAYSRGRYITVTGHTFRDSPAKLADLTFLFSLLDRLG